MDAIVQFSAAIVAAGLTPPDEIRADGKLHRFASNGNPNDDSGWYVLHVDGLPAGQFGDWRSGLTERWRAAGAQKMSPSQAAAAKAAAADMRRERKADEVRRQVDAENKALALWQAGAPAAADHPYLARKQVSPVATLREIGVEEAIRILNYQPKSRGECLIGRLLIVPIKIGDTISTCEMIDEAGRKSSIFGGARGGGYWAAQALPHGDGAGFTLLIAEGVATALSAASATGHPVVASLSSGNLSAVAQLMRIRYPAAGLVIAADLVKDTGEPDPHAINATREARAALAAPDFGSDRKPGQTDFNDLALECGADAVRRAIATAVDAPEYQGEVDGDEATEALLAHYEGVESGQAAAEVIKKARTAADKTAALRSANWILTERGRIQQCMSNCIHWIEKTGLASRIRHNCLRGRNEWLDEKDCSWGNVTDDRVLELKRQMERDIDGAVSTAHMQEAITVEANDAPFEPIHEYLIAVAAQWDGTTRLEHLFEDVFGADESAFTQEIARVMMLQAVARALKPGCKADHVVIIRGRQGMLKSTFVATLCPDPAWYGDGVFGDLSDSRAVVESLGGRWIVEIPEFDRFARTSRNTLKSFISQQVDTARAAYGRQSESHPRRVVLIATTNDTEILEDTTGNRRFLAVQIHSAGDMARLEAMRDQLWGEATVRYQRGEQTWLDRKFEEEQAASNEAMEVHDVLEDSVNDFLSKWPGGGFAMADIFDHWKIAIDRRDRSLQIRTGNVLTKLGYVSKKIRLGKEFCRRYEKAPQG